MITIFPDIKHAGPENHLFWVRKTKESVDIPVIASLNAVHEETWIEYSKLLEQTGLSFNESKTEALDQLKKIIKELGHEAELIAKDSITADPIDRRKGVA